MQAGQRLAAAPQARARPRAMAANSGSQARCVPPPSLNQGRASSPAPCPARQPSRPAAAERMSASVSTTRITWPERKPMARKMPISLVRSLTLPIMVTSTTRAPSRATRAETPRAKRWNEAMVSMRPLTTLWMAMTLAPGRARPIWATMASMGQSLHRAATSTMDTRPCLPKSSWAGARGMNSKWSSWLPVGSNTPLTVNSRPLRVSWSPSLSPSRRAASAPGVTWPGPGSTPRTFHQGLRMRASRQSTPAKSTGWEPTSTRPRTMGPTAATLAAFFMLFRLARSACLISWVAKEKPPRLRPPQERLSWSLLGVMRMLAPYFSSLWFTSWVRAEPRPMRATMVATPVSRPASTKAALAFLRRKLSSAMSVRFMMLALLGEVEVAAAIGYVGHPDDDLVALDHAPERGRVAAALDLVDAHRGEAAAAVGTDHHVAVLVIALARGPAHVAGVVGRPDDPIGALDHEEAHRDAAGQAVLKVAGLVVGEELHRQGHHLLAGLALGGRGGRVVGRGLLAAAHGPPGHSAGQHHRGQHQDQGQGLGGAFFVFAQDLGLLVARGGGVVLVLLRHVSLLCVWSIRSGRQGRNGAGEPRAHQGAARRMRLERGLQINRLAWVRQSGTGARARDWGAAVGREARGRMPAGARPMAAKATAGRWEGLRARGRLSQGASSRQQWPVWRARQQPEGPGMAW
eukprot:TRINITY_DN33549_c0_g1_i2.p1 TRINITY_DN33549_c0_g1~~TRINITY_DN33549_c0_g1_i2.p1  ORF type:complete len:688 (-),score=200.10 TRINITY_DN33549_c0_g1_i2:1901-3964(-)